MMKQLKHIIVNINDLKPAAYNPREELAFLLEGIWLILLTETE